MDKIKYNEIRKDKDNLLFIISEMIRVYNLKQNSIKILECCKWIKLLNEPTINTEFSSDELISLKDIMNDAANYLISVEYRLDDGELAYDLMKSISKLFNKNNE